jgi:hypothetical protein
MLASLSIVQTVLTESFDCKGISKISQIAGKILFLVPDQVDQVMDYGKKGNLTRDLHAVKSDQALITLREQDHWSKWTFTTYNEVLEFLAEWGIVNANFNRVQEDKFPSSEPLTCFKKECVPVLTKAYL